MHFHEDENLGPQTVQVRIILENPEEINEDGSDKAEHVLMAAKGEHLLNLALRHHINIEHSCGGVCACSTCHVQIEEGMDSISEAEETEEDRVEEAPGLQINSRLACQCDVVGDGPIVMRVPSWNRNAIKEVPH